MEKSTTSLNKKHRKHNLSIYCEYLYLKFLIIFVYCKMYQQSCIIRKSNFPCIQ